MSKEQLPEQYDDVSEEFGTEEYDADIDTGDSPVAASNTNKIMGIIILVILIAGVLFFTFSGEDQEELEAEEKKIEVYDLKSGPEGEAFNVAPEPVGEIDPVLDTISPEEEVISDVVTLDVPELPDLQVSALPSTEDFNIEPEFQENDLFDQMEDSTP